METVYDPGDCISYLSLENTRWQSWVYWCTLASQCTKKCMTSNSKQPPCWTWSWHFLLLSRDVFLSLEWIQMWSLVAFNSKRRSGCFRDWTMQINSRHAESPGHPARVKITEGVSKGLRWEQKRQYGSVIMINTATGHIKPFTSTDL